MNKNNREAILVDLLDQKLDIYRKKNSDYGNSFSSTIAEYGFISALVRIEDKLNRVKSISKKGLENIEVKDEKLEDTLVDLSNYIDLLIVELRDSNYDIKFINPNIIDSINKK